MLKKLRLYSNPYLQPLADIRCDQMHQAQLGESLVPRQHEILAVQEDEVHLRGDEKQPRGGYDRPDRSARGELCADLQPREHEATRAEPHGAQA